jgi:hypothetical protein
MKTKKRISEDDIVREWDKKLRQVYEEVVHIALSRGAVINNRMYVIMHIDDVRRIAAKHDVAISIFADLMRCGCITITDIHEGALRCVELKKVMGSDLNHSVERGIYAFN